MVKGHKVGKKFHPHNNSGKGIKSTDFDSSDDTNTEWRARELDEYADRLKRDFADTVVTILKISVPAIAHTDPHFATAYVLFQFAQYSYHFIKQVIENYRLNGGDLYDAISSQVTSEMKEKIYSYFATKSFEKIAEIITDGLWSNCRQDTDKIEFYSSLETKIKRVMTEEIHLMLKSDLKTPTAKTELERNLWKAYFEELLNEELTENETNIERELVSVSEVLADLLVSEDQMFINPSSIITGTFDAKTWLQSRISTITCN